MGKPFYQWTTQELVERFRQLDRKKKIRVLAWTAGALVFFIFVVWPSWFLRPQLKTQVESLHNQIQMAQGQIYGEKSLLEERKKLEAYLWEIHSRLFSKEEVENIAGVLAEMAKVSEVTLVDISPETAQGQGAQSPLPDPSAQPTLALAADYEAVGYEVSAEGGYHALASFVSQLENHPKLFRVDELSILTKLESASSHFLNIRLSAYAGPVAAKTQRERS